jgi:hypothetical protein
MALIREPAVAGSFYPSHPEVLSGTVRSLLGNIPESAGTPKAVIVPHAGYAYSGGVAGAAYSILEKNPNPGTILLVGPAHRHPVRGVATSSAEYFRTPMGEIPINRDVVEKILSGRGAVVSDEAHREEHSLEVQLPFLQSIYKKMSIVPVVTGLSDRAVLGMFERVASNVGLIVISSDLSHFLRYEEAVEIDEKTSESIETLSPETIHNSQACGYAAICGYLRFAREMGMKATRLKSANSGDISGNRLRVVGYGSFLFI